MEEKIIDVYRREVYEQPVRLAELCAAYSSDPEIHSQMEALKKVLPPGLPVLWLGMGASFSSALAGATTLSMTGNASFVVEASEWLHYADEVKSLTAPILVTTSGESVELVELARRSRSRSLPCIVLCNQSGSPCWSEADIRFPILAGPERANATKTYVNSAAAGIILASELASRSWQSEVDQAVSGFGQSLRTVLDRRQEMEQFSRHAHNIEIIGRGPALAGALMGALCIREMTGVRAFAHSGGGFRHGPLLDVDPTHVSIILALGRTRELGLRLAADCDQRGGSVVLLGSGRMPASSDRMLCIPLDQVPEAWESLTSVLAAQALTLALAEVKGSNYVRVQTTSE
jgi:glucosamine--fructose-6-phosphate aminotransferase (isomerizing)